MIFLYPIDKNDPPAGAVAAAIHLAVEAGYAGEWSHAGPGDGAVALLDRRDLFALLVFPDGSADEYDLSEDELAACERDGGSYAIPTRASFF